MIYIINRLIAIAYQDDSDKRKKEGVEYTFLLEIALIKKKRRLAARRNESFDLGRDYLMKQEFLLDELIDLD